MTTVRPVMLRYNGAVYEASATMRPDGQIEIGGDIWIAPLKNALPADAQRLALRIIQAHWANWPKFQPGYDLNDWEAALAAAETAE